MIILVVAAHPDDETFGCGGTMARHAAQGDEVHVLVVTRGSPEMFPTELIETGRRELQAACQILGVSQVHSLDFPAAKLDAVPGYAIADAIGEIIRSLQPSIVYLPHRGDLHADHRAVYLATLVASRPINHCPVRRLLCYETLSETDWSPPTGDDAFVPTVFVDIADHLEQKTRALACYQSQVKPSPHTRSLRSAEALARLRGGTVSVDAAEAFMLVREIIA
jgi:LmbE family N-acetylglucosaminyl deacetylase